MRFWWVNQNQTFHQEVQGGYIWSPKRNANGARNPFYETMREVAPGDLILSFADTRIKALGRARSYCFECPKPAEFGTAGPNWSEIGWRVEVQWEPLINQIRPKDHIDRIRPYLPPRYSPLTARGDGLQSIYLTSVPESLAQLIGGLIGPEFAARATDASGIEEPSLFVLADLPAVDDWEEHLQQHITANEEIPETDRRALVQARRGQGLFKRRVSTIERECRITHVNNPIHLVASHCKPWRDSDDRERLDGENGLLLTPSIDHLFDRGFISFDNSGGLLISPVAHRPSLEKMGVPTTESLNVGTFSSRQREYLQYHRDSVFLERRSR